jgi:hypothetical protein
MQPSQIIPSTANVTVAERGEVRQALAQRAIVAKNRRLVMGMCPRTRNHITKSQFVNGIVETSNAQCRMLNAECQMVPMISVMALGILH